MRFAIFLALLLQSMLCCEGFSPLSQNAKTKLSRSALFATNEREQQKQVDLQQKAAQIAATLALGWAVGASASFAAPPSNNDWSSATMASSNIVVALGDSDFADFSLPSYEETSKADVNTNLKGGKYLLGEASKSYSFTR